MTPYQMKQARLQLGLTQIRLAILVDMHTGVISAYEKTGHVHPPSSKYPKIDRIACIRAFFEDAGIEFLDGTHPDIRLKKPHAA